MEQTLLPLIIAAVGVLGVCVAAMISATSVLRIRLIDIQTQEAAERRAFHARMVAAINEAGSSVEDLIMQLLTRLDSTKRHSFSSSMVTAEEAQMRFEQLKSATGEASDRKDSPGVQKLRLAQADAQWRIAVAESHIYAEREAYDAIRKFSAVRAKVHGKVLAALSEERLQNAVANLRSASEMQKTCMQIHATNAYHALQNDRAAADSRIFTLAHVTRLRHVAKKLQKATQAHIELKKEIIAKNDA